MRSDNYLPHISHLTPFNFCPVCRPSRRARNAALSQRNPKAYIGALEDPKRDAYQKPQEVMTALGIKPGEVIGDIGAGSGYFTFRLALHVGAKGRQGLRGGRESGYDPAS